MGLAVLMMTLVAPRAKVCRLVMPLGLLVIALVMTLVVLVSVPLGAPKLALLPMHVVVVLSVSFPVEVRTTTTPVSGLRLVLWVPRVWATCPPWQGPQRLLICRSRAVL